MGTNLREDQPGSWNQSLTVNNPGEPVTAGVVALWAQRLVNRLRSIFGGRVALRAVQVDPGTTGDVVAVPVDANGDPEALVLKPVAAQSPRSLRYGNLHLRLIDVGRQVTVSADGIYGTNWAHDASISVVDGPRGRVEVLPGGIRFLRLFAAADGGNPSRLTAVINEVKPNLLIKAWGIIITDGQGGVVSPGQNQTGTEGAGGWNFQLTASGIVLTWQFSFADLSYSVVVSGGRRNGVRMAPVEEDLDSRTRNSTKIVSYAPDGTLLDPRAVALVIQFNACGRQ